MNIIQHGQLRRSALGAFFLCSLLQVFAQNQTVNGNLSVAGALDVSGNQFTLGTQSGSYGAGYFYFDADTDTLSTRLNRPVASWLWEHSVTSGTISVMRLDSSHNLLLYAPNVASAGVILNPTTNTISLGDVTLYRSAAGMLRTDGGIIVDGAFTSASYTSSGGAITGGAAGLTLNAGGVDQSVTVNASGTGSIVLGGGTVTFTGDLRPLTHNAFDLGLPLQRWRSAFVLGSTVTGSLLVDTGNISGGVAGLSLSAGGADQNISLGASGSGNISLLSPLGVAIAAPGIAQFRRTDTTPAGVGLTIGADDAGPYLDTQQVHNFRFLVNGTEAGRFAGNGDLLVGTTSDSGNGRLQLASHAAAAGGIGFGADTNLYRSAAGTLKTDGKLVVAGNARFDGTVRIAPQGDLSMGEFTSEPQ